MARNKYALLDTDFISKMYLIRKDNHNKLIDKIMEMPNYLFYCHEQIDIELARHNIAGAYEWFEKKTTEKTITVYDDKMLMDVLSEVYGEWATVVYLGMLKTACEAYRARYFEENFIGLLQMNDLCRDRQAFLNQLGSECSRIGERQNLGELKTYVLLQVLNVRFGEQIYVFCSDDKEVRSGIISIGGARCISVLSAFIRLQKEIGFTKEEAEPYIKSYMSSCLGEQQTTFKVQEISKEKRLCKVPCEQVFSEMFEGKIVEMKTGDLKYIENSDWVDGN